MGRMREKVQGIRSVKSRYKIRQREVKNNVGNVEAKELICTTHGHDLRWRNADRRGGTGQRGIKGRKNGITVTA